MFKRSVFVKFIAVLFLINAAISVYAADPCNFAGGWCGNWFSIYDEQDWVNVWLEQEGTQLTGYMDVSTAYYGDMLGVPITGTVSGNRANFTATYVEDGYTYSFKYVNAILVKDPVQNIYVISGTYTVLENGRLWDRGTFSLDDISQLPNRMPEPDFTIQDISLTPTTPVAERKFTAEITVANEGDARGNPGFLKIYHADDEANAILVRVPVLQAGQQRVVKVLNKLTAELGDTTLIAEIDPDNTAAEKDETNNTFQKDYTGGEPRVDVAVTGIELTPGSVPETGTFNAEITVENTGTEAADAGYLQMYLDGTPVGRAMRVSRMNAGQVKTVKMTRLPANVTAGPHIVSAVVDCDNTLTETDEINNTCLTNLTVTDAPKPDFTVQDVNLIPATLVADRKFNVEITVANIGNASGNPGFLKVYHAGDEPNALLIRVPVIQAGQQKVIKVTNKLTALPGNNAVIAVIDPDDSALEQDETNNTLQSDYTGGQAQVDVAVTGIELSPASVPENTTFNAVVTVENTGSEACDAGNLQVYLDGEPVGRAMRVSRMNAGQVKAVRMTRLPANVLMGQHEVSAVVDCDNTLTEVNEGNNGFQVALDVTEAPKPDLVIENVELNPAYPEPGERFTATVWIKNQGEARSTGGYLDVWTGVETSINASLSLSSPALSFSAVRPAPSATIKLPTLNPGANAVRKVISGLYSPGNTGDQIFTALIDSDDDVLETDELNNDFMQAYPNPLWTYYPFNDGDWKDFNDVRHDVEWNQALSATKRNTIYNETIQVDYYGTQESTRYIGYYNGNLVAYGSESSDLGQGYLFTQPLVISTAELMQNGGEADFSTRFTLQGYNVTLKLACTVDILPEVNTALGTFYDCRKLSYEGEISVMNVSLGLLMKNSSILAPGVGTVMEKVYGLEVDQFSQTIDMFELFEAFIQDGQINGTDISGD